MKNLMGLLLMLLGTIGCGLIISNIGIGSFMFGLWIGFVSMMVVKIEEV